MKKDFLIISLLLEKVDLGKFGKFSIIKQEIYMQWNKCLNQCKEILYTEF